jgi:hypothetical protein
LANVTGPPEIGHLAQGAGRTNQENVVGLDVAMDDAHAVHLNDSQSSVAKNPQSVRPGERVAPKDQNLCEGGLRELKDHKGHLDSCRGVSPGY